MRYTLLLFAVACAAQPVLTPSSVQKYKRTGPMRQTNQFIAVTSSPSGCTIAASITGGSLTAGDDVAVSVVVGTTPGTVKIIPSYHIYERTVGDWTSIITVTLSGGGGCSGSAAFTYNLKIVPALPYFPVYKVNSFSADHCVNTNTTYPDNDTCTYPTDNSMLGSSPLTPAPVGQQVNGEWGGYIRTLSTPSWNGLQWSRIHPYSSVGPFSYDGSMVWFFNLGQPTGPFEFVDRNTGAQTWTNGPGANDLTILDSHDNSYWQLEPQGAGKIRHYVLTTPPSTFTLVDEFDYTSLGFGATPFWTGSSARMTPDGWFSFFAFEEGARQGTSVKKACALNTNGLTQANHLSKMYCADYTATGMVTLNLIFVTNVDRASGLRYVYAMGNPSVLFSVNTTTQTLDFVAMPEGESDGVAAGRSGSVNNNNGLCEPGEFCPIGAHADVTEFDGEQALCDVRDGYGTNNIGTVTYVGCHYFNRGKQMYEALEAGGGTFLVMPLAPYQVSYEIGCSWAGVCVAGGYTNGVNAAAVRSITATAPAVLNIGDAWRGWATGQKVAAGGATLGDLSWDTCTKGNWVITVIDVDHVSLNGSDCTAATGYYAPNSLGLGRNDWEAIKAPYQAENIVFDDMTAIRAGFTRAYPHASDDRPDTYYQYPMTGLSPDGQTMVFHSNFGVPRDVRSYLAPSMWSTARKIKPIITPSSTTAVISAGMPETAMCAITVSTSRSLAAPVFTLSTIARYSLNTVATGLTASTVYWARVNCGGGKYVWTGAFTTTAAPTGSAPVATIMLGTIGAADIVMDYGTTAALGTTSAATTCDAGAQCTAVASVARGLVYGRARIRNGGGATIVTGPTSVFRN